MMKQKTTRPVFPVTASPINTPRLLLRQIKQSDLADFHALRTQIEVMKWTSTAKIDVDLEATQVWLNRYLAPNNATTFNFAVEELAVPGTVIGALGCKSSEPLECGYMLRTEMWGKGYATEALQHWLRAYWELPRTEVEIESTSQISSGDADSDVVLVPEILMADLDANNAASARILVKCGFRLVGEEMIELNGESVKLAVFNLERPIEGP